jgi:hypothetical protein
MKPSPDLSHFGESTSLGSFMPGDDEALRPAPAPAPTCLTPAMSGSCCGPCCSWKRWWAWSPCSAPPAHRVAAALFAAHRRGAAGHAGLAGRRVPAEVTPEPAGGLAPVAVRHGAGRVVRPVRLRPAGFDGPAAAGAPVVQRGGRRAAVGHDAGRAVLARQGAHAGRHGGAPGRTAVAHPPPLPVQHPQQRHRAGARRAGQGRGRAGRPERAVPPRAGRPGRVGHPGAGNRAGAALPGHRADALRRAPAGAVEPGPGGTWPSCRRCCCSRWWKTPSSTAWSPAPAARS